MKLPLCLKVKSHVFYVEQYVAKLFAFVVDIKYHCLNIHVSKSYPRNSRYEEITFMCSTLVHAECIEIF